MKLFSIFALLLVISCAQEQNQVIGTVDEVKTYEPVMVGFEDGERIKAICRDLSSKEDILNILVNNGTEYTFDYAQKGCEDKEISETKQVVTTIVASGDNFIFKTKNGEAFGFNNVETSSKGIMAEICKSTGYLMSPMQTSSSGAIWFTSMASSQECKSDINGLCMYIQRGSFVSGTKYQIHTNDWIKFRTTADKKGFFMERKMISSAGCGTGKTIVRKAVLK